MNKIILYAIISVTAFILSASAYVFYGYENDEQVKHDLTDNTPLTEEELSLLSCNEITELTYSGNIDYSNGVRKFVRDKVLDCNNMYELTIHYASCSSILIMAQAPLTYYVQNDRTAIQSEIYKCIRDNEFKIDDILVTHQVDICIEYPRKAINILEYCNNVEYLSDPITKPADIEEIYPLVIENEREIYNNIPCPVLKDTYDGKMNRLYGSFLHDIVHDALQACKDGQ
jgi:hypothetical protein